MPVTLADAKKKYPKAETFKFGDSDFLCNELLALVRNGKKRATCGVERDFQSGLEAMPEIGRQDIALTWDGQPSLVIETMRLERVRFCDMPKDWALMEGENDTLDEWRRGHEAYYTRNNKFDPQMWLIWEQFSLVEDFCNETE